MEHLPDSNADPGSALAHPVRKRRRVPLACSTCRDRKTRCDGGKPICASCNRKGIGDSCFYEDGVLQNQRYISGLISKTTDPERGNTSASTEVPQNEQLHSRFPSEKFPQSHPEERTDYGSIDALGTTSSAKNTDAVYGGSSTIAFVSSVENVTAKENEPACSPQLSQSPRVSHTIQNNQGIHGLEPVPHTSKNNACLPNKHVTDEFLNCYWHYVHPLFPIIQKSSFQRRYQRQWGQSQFYIPNKDLDETIFMSTLKLMLALGCQFSSTILPADRNARASEFYQQSKDLLSFDILDSMHLPLVQLFLLTGVYLQSTKYADRCWNVVGLAIRIAHGLGLHVEQESDTSSHLETELRRRIWHTCIILDRLLAMTFGRPTIIANKETAVKTPQLIEDEYPITNRSSNSSNRVPSQGLFVYSLNLYDILDIILATFYLKQNGSLTAKQHDNSDSSTAYLTEILNLNAELDKFYDGVPDYLKPQEETTDLSRMEQYDNAELQINVLNCRFLYVRILLLRPLLFSQAKKNIALQKSPTHQTNHSLQSGIVNSACSLCLRTVYELISSIHDTLENPNRSSPWHTVYFAFSGAMILVTSRLCRFDPSVTDEIRLQESWDKCIAILNYHKSQVQSATQTISILEQSWSRITDIKGSTTDRVEQPLITTLFDQQPTSAMTSRYTGNTQTISDSELQASNLNFTTDEQARQWDRVGDVNSTEIQMDQSIESNFNTLSQVDDAWFTQTFLESDWLNTVRDEGGFFF